MTKLAEQNQWYKGKRHLVDDYLKNAKQVEDIVSGRGHLYRPGFLSDGITQIERGLKFGLSDLNYQITADAISRELAQSGHDYDIAYKEARIAWELEKSTLYTALEQEFADNKHARGLDIQELNRVEITVNLRKLVIMAAKTAIDIDIEELRQEMTRVDQSTFSAEDALLAAKLLTAEKKLEVIPYIEIVLEKQQLIIDAESDNADRKEALITEKGLLNDKRIDLITAREAIAGAIVVLIAAKQELVTKRESLIVAKELVADQEITNIGYLDQYIRALSGLSDVQQDLVKAKRALIPKINEKSMALIAYAAELDAWVIVKNAIAVVKEDIAEYMEIRADRKGDIIDARVDLNSLKLNLQEAQINLEIAKMTGRSDLMRQKITNAGPMLTERETSFKATIKRDGELLDAKINFDLYGEKQDFASMKEINDFVIPKEVGSVKRVAAARILERRGVAAIASGAELTSKLVHLLS